MQQAMRTICQQGPMARPGARTAKAANAPKLAPRLLGAGLLSYTGSAFAADLDLPQVSLPELPAGAGSDLAALVSDNPLLVGGTLALLLIPLGINAILGGGGSGKAISVTSAARALEALEQNANVILLDIRSKAEIKASGTPDLSGIKRKAVALPYTSVAKGEETVDEKFAEKFAKLGGLGGLDTEARVILLDGAGDQAGAAAKAILATGAVSKIYVIEGGAEGTKGWRASGLPWKEPGKLTLPSLNIDLKNLPATIEALTEEVKNAPSLTKAGLAAVGIGAAGFLLFNEIQVLLELVGLVAAGQFALKLLFAEEREQTLTEIRSLVNDKMAVGEAGEDLKKLATVLLDETEGGKPAEAAEPAKRAAAAEKKPEPAAAPAEPAAPAVAAATGGNGVAAASENGEVPENVKEARDWIAAYKARSSAN